MQIVDKSKKGQLFAVTWKNEGDLEPHFAYFRSADAADSYVDKLKSAAFILRCGFVYSPYVRALEVLK